MSNECDTCDGSGTIVTDSDRDGEFIVERCDNCCKFNDDLEAACSRFREVRVLANQPILTDIESLADHIGSILDESDRSAIRLAIDEFLKNTKMKIVKEK